MVKGSKSEVADAAAESWATEDKPARVNGSTRGPIGGSVIVIASESVLRLESGPAVWKVKGSKRLVGRVATLVRNSFGSLKLPEN